MRASPNARPEGQAILGDVVMAELNVIEFALFGFRSFGGPNTISPQCSVTMGAFAPRTGHSGNLHERVQAKRMEECGRNSRPRDEIEVLLR